MGYQTEFEGSLTIAPPLLPYTHQFLHDFRNNRHVKRRGMPSAYGPEGMYYTWNMYDDSDPYGDKIVDRNVPPEGLPDLFCWWKVNEEGTALFWNEVETYHYQEWLEFLRDYLKERGHILSGNIRWQGEDREDRGTISVNNSVITIIQGAEGDLHWAIENVISKKEKVKNDPILKLLKRLVEEKMLRIGPDGQDVQQVKPQDSAYVLYDFDYDFEN